MKAQINVGVARVVRRALDGDLRPEERRVLLDALDAVPRKREEIAKDMLARRACEAEEERDQLRELLVSAEGYALAKGADRPFVCMFAEDAPQVEIIERAGCYPRSARRENPGRFFLNPPPDEAVSGDGEATS